MQLVVKDYGQYGRAFVETDIAEADRETVLRNFISGQYSNALRVIAFNTAEGWSRDVSEDVADELLQLACDAWKAGVLSMEASGGEHNPASLAGAAEDAAQVNPSGARSRGCTSKRS